MRRTSNSKLTLSSLIICSWLSAVVVAGGCSGDGLTDADARIETGAKAGESPVIDVWYGDYKRFGQAGNPQVWANILGNVDDADGIASLAYSLNGGPQVSLTVGPDPYRLQLSGDFNIDLLRSNLSDGLNEVVITAVDNGSPPSEAVKTVTVDYTSDPQVPLPFSVNWDQLSAFDDAVHVVDGAWERNGASVRTTVPGWDRLIAFGDMAWADYEVTVPIMFHSLSPIMATGLVLRWNGHTDQPSDFAGVQPKAGFLPVGSLLWFKYDRLAVTGNGSQEIASQSRTLSTGVWYTFKARAETIPGVGAEYSLKVWQTGQPEPADWDLVGIEYVNYAESGGAMLVSHEADASFGNVTVTPLSPDVNLSISNISVSVSADLTEATIEWATNQPATSSVAYGLTSSYELSAESDASLKTSHSVVLPNLNPSTLYHYQIASEDSLGDSVATGDRTFCTGKPPGGPSSGIVSDDFNTGTLDTSVWMFVDPQGDGDYSLTGTNTEDAWLNISVPAGGYNEVWTSGVLVPHIEQAVDDEDFEIEVKLESSVNLAYQEQGVVIKQDDGNYMRFEFYGDGSSTNNFVASFKSYGLSIRAHSRVDSDGVAPLYMRIRREGDLWTQTYSTDGSTWIAGTSFTHSIQVTGIGLYAGNVSGPAHTASFDYFLNTASPLISEDSSLPWSIQNVQSSADETTATVTWTTGEATSSEVFFGPTAAYENGSVFDGTLGTNHSVALTNLDPSTLYHFQVMSVDASSNTLNSTDGVFTTADSAPVWTIQSVQSSADETTATVTWTTDEATSSEVSFGPTAAYESGSAFDGALVTNHSVALTNLDPSTLYHFQVTSVDGFSNSMSSADSTFTTLDAPPQWSIRNIQVNADETTATVSWTTDIPTMSEVFHGPSAAYEDGSVFDSAFVTNHNIVLSGLDPSTLYHFQVTSVDVSSNSMSSADLTFTTLDAPPQWSIHNVQVSAGETRATVSWTTDIPTMSEVFHGRTATYESGSVFDSAFVTDHSVVLPNLDSSTLYHFRVTSIDSSAGSMSTIDSTFITAEPPGGSDPSGIISDDFSSNTLDTTVWTFVDPQGDGGYSLTGSNTQNAWLNISVPTGGYNEVWSSGVLVPHIEQAVVDEDFEIEVKLESSVNLAYQEQGVVIKQDDGHYMRFEFYGDGSSTNNFVASFNSRSPSIRAHSRVDSGGVAPLYMRIRREGDLWTQTYSTDGSTWIAGTSFTHSIQVTGIGLYAGNLGGPGHTASFDYFLNTASPAISEDSTLP